MKSYSKFTHVPHVPGGFVYEDLQWYLILIKVTKIQNVSNDTFSKKTTKIVRGEPSKCFESFEFNSTFKGCYMSEVIIIFESMVFKEYSLCIFLILFR